MSLTDRDNLEEHYPYRRPFSLAELAIRPRWVVRLDVQGGGHAASKPDERERSQSLHTILREDLPLQTAAR